TQHRLLVLDFKMKGCKRKNKLNYYPRIRWGHLKNTNKNIFKSKLQEIRIWDVHKETNVMWKNISSEIK
ncbi:hypothetical protein PWG14_24650, partial [Chromobacterium amazonense]|uniref:hypothetical protein n=1 Tax=Chromobacterium amazonense TaxID=1382803 RepID=UPI00237E65C7